MATLAAALASCAKPKPDRARKFDAKVLDERFPLLADAARPGDFDLAVMHLQSTQTWFWNLATRFPLAAAAVGPIAAAVFAEADAGRLNLGEAITIRDVDLSPPPSGLATAWTGKPIAVSAAALLKLALAGDNTAADVLMARVGGPGAVTAWLRNKGLASMRIDRYARQWVMDLHGLASFRPAWRTEAAFFRTLETVSPHDRETAMSAFVADPRDTTTATDALGFLSKLGNGELLSRASTSRLMALMAASPVARMGFGAALPAGASLAQATGPGVTDLGFTPAQSALGVLTLEDGRRYAIAGFLAGSTATRERRNRLFADAALLVLRAAG